MHVMNQDQLRSVVMRHLVAEAAAQLVAHKKKGEVNGRFDTAGHVVREMLYSENHAAKTAGCIVRLALRRGQLMKELLKKGILVKSRGHEESLRKFDGDSEVDPSISAGCASSRATTSGDIEVADALR